MRALLSPLLFASISTFAQQPRVAHVLVALCDNEHQGIVKVPAGIGNGQNARTNLYWGAGYGVKTHFDRAEEWTRIPCEAATEPHILDRAVWRHRDSSVYIVAEAYDGRNIREATIDLLRYAGGAGPRQVLANGTALNAGGNASLIAYVGHDGLMDFTLEERYNGPVGNTRETIILACISKRYFAEHLRATKAQPLVWTTGLMAPEAYTLRAALNGWVRRETAEQIRERAATAYDKYQRCGINGARRLLVTGW
ncbi:MAG TPA: hypothetical protein PKY96_04900 [Flavobacteriales bacterium]|nr:hypothetical protein [Flavobacteriales bacterium]